MIYLTNSNHDKFERGKNGIIYHTYVFCGLANSDYIIQGLPIIEDNSGLRDVTLEINDRIMQNRNLRKCSWCERFASLAIEIQNEYINLRQVSIRQPTEENLARFLAFAHVYLG